jgi:hypothetical protein
MFNPCTAHHLKRPVKIRRCGLFLFAATASILRPGSNAGSNVAAELAEDFPTRFFIDARKRIAGRMSGAARFGRVGAEAAQKKPWMLLAF